VCVDDEEKKKAAVDQYADTLMVKTLGRIVLGLDFQESAYDVSPSCCGEVAL